MLEEEIRDAFYNIENNHKERSPKEIYVTEVLWCPRKAYFNYVFNARPRRNLAMVLGTIYHGAIQKLPFWEGKSARFETGTFRYEYRGFYITGRPDVITEDPKAIWEFKFPYKVGNEATKPKYLMQLNTYLTVLDYDLGYLVEVEFSWKDKDIVVAVTEQNRDDKLFHEFLKRADVIIDAIENQKIPPKTELSWECKDCPYKIICDMFDNEEKG